MLFVGLFCVVCGAVCELFVRKLFHLFVRKIRKVRGFDFCSASKSGSSLVRSPCVVDLEARRYKIPKGFRKPELAPTNILMFSEQFPELPEGAEASALLNFLGFS